MFDSIFQVLVALWHQDFTALMAPGSAGLIYFVVVALIFLESGFIPAAPFPCDSVVVLSGTLAAVGVLDPVVIMLVIVVSAAMGSWAAYLQGRWLNRLPKSGVGECRPCETSRASRRALGQTWTDCSVLCTIYSGRSFITSVDDGTSC